jgi:hypothetical protein
VPRLQTGGQLCALLQDHLGNRITSPAAIRSIHRRFVQHDDSARNRSRFQADEGVMFISISLDRQFSFKATKQIIGPRTVRFCFSRQSGAVNQYYCYLQDAEWGTSLYQGG